MRAACRAVAGSLVGALIVLGAAGTGVAHGAEPLPPGPMGEMRVVEREATGPRQMRYVVRLTSFPELEPIDDGRITAEATGPDGATVGPVALRPTGTEPGVYAATLDFPSLGRWEVAITAASPAITISITESLVEQATTTTSITVDPASAGSGDGGGGGVPTLALPLLVVFVAAVLFVVARPGAQRRGRHSA